MPDFAHATPVSAATEAPLIRPETATDFAAIRSLVTAAFGSSEHGALVDRIRASPGYVPAFALVAVVAGQVAGHVILSACDVVHATGRQRIALLSPLAVLPALQQRGIGRALVAAALRAADDAGEPLVVVEGDPAYYGKSGFRFAGDHGLTLPIPDWAPATAAQVSLLSRHDPSDTRYRGRVVYPPAFDDM